MGDSAASSNTCDPLPDCSNHPGPQSPHEVPRYVHFCQTLMQFCRLSETHVKPRLRHGRRYQLFIMTNEPRYWMDPQLEDQVERIQWT